MQLQCYIYMTNGQAEASEANEKPSTNQESKVVSQTEQNSKENKNSRI